MSFKALAGGSHGLTPRARRSLDVRDDGPDATGAGVLTYRGPYLPLLDLSP